MSELIFLGTGGARVLVFKQLLASGGLWLESGPTRLSIDPGPGALVQAIKRKLDPARLDGIVLTHRHLDHSADVNSMIEAMTTGGFHRRGVLFAPLDALEDDPVVLRYLRPYLERVEILREGGRYQVGEIAFTTPVRHLHQVETYGLRFELAEATLSYLADTRFFPELADHYRAEVMVINVVFLEPREYDHLSLDQARQVIEAARPRLAVLTHFGMTMWRARPWELAEKMAQQTGIQVVAARDGMRVNLAAAQVVKQARTAS